MVASRGLCFLGINPEMYLTMVLIDKKPSNKSGIPDSCGKTMLLKFPLFL